MQLDDHTFCNEMIQHNPRDGCVIAAYNDGDKEQVDQEIEVWHREELGNVAVASLGPTAISH